MKKMKRKQRPPSTSFISLEEEETKVTIRCDYYFTFVEKGKGVRLVSSTGPKSNPPNFFLWPAAKRAKAVLADHRQRKARKVFIERMQQSLSFSPTPHRSQNGQLDLFQESAA